MEERRGYQFHHRNCNHQVESDEEIDLDWKSSREDDCGEGCDGEGCDGWDSHRVCVSR